MVGIAENEVNRERGLAMVGLIPPQSMRVAAVVLVCSVTWLDR